MLSAVRNAITRSLVRAVRVTALAAGSWALALLAAPVAAAAAADNLAAPSTNTFGLLGPVGVVAVGVGIVGMVAGFARRRRDALGRAVASRGILAEQAPVARSRREQPLPREIPGPSRPPAVEHPVRVSQDRSTSRARQHRAA